MNLIFILNILFIHVKFQIVFISFTIHPMEWREIFEKELSTAVFARSRGNEGMARCLCPARSRGCSR